MAQLGANHLRSNGSGFNDVVVHQNSGGTENGRLCRAWVNFNGTGTPAIRGNFNVSTITDNGVGEYTVTFTNNMSDANYAMVGTDGENVSTDGSVHFTAEPTTSSVTIESGKEGGFSPRDRVHIHVAIFR